MYNGTYVINNSKINIRKNEICIFTDHLATAPLKIPRNGEKLSTAAVARGKRPIYQCFDKNDRLVTIC